MTPTTAMTGRLLMKALRKLPKGQLDKPVRFVNDPNYLRTSMYAPCEVTAVHGKRHSVELEGSEP